MLSPSEVYNTLNGNAYDMDGSYGAQCWDGWAKFVTMMGMPFNNCAKTYTGWADGAWTNRGKTGVLEYMNAYTDLSKLQDGDWCFWAYGSSTAPYSHVAMYYAGKFFGQNQNGRMYFHLDSISKNGIVGFLRMKGWDIQFVKPTPVERDTGKKQIEILASDIRLRYGANGAMTGYVCNKGIYNILGNSQAGEYMWYQIQGGNADKVTGQMWVAYSSAWAKLYDVEDKDKIIETLKSEVQELQAKVKTMTTERDNLTKQISEQNTKINKALEALK